MLQFKLMNVITNFTELFTNVNKLTMIQVLCSYLHRTEDIQVLRSNLQMSIINSKRSLVINNVQRSSGLHI